MATPTHTGTSVEVDKRPSIDSEQGMMILLLVIVTLSVIAVFLVGG